VSEHTDTTARMTDRVRVIVDNYRKHYNVSLTISDPKNKDASILTDIRWKLDQAVRWAERRGYTATYAVTATPKEPCKYNCKGCRKRKSGDYFWVTAKLGSLKKSKDEEEDDGYMRGWDQPLAKVCSTECGEMMILRLM
jgi:hypothetical protein